MSANPDGTIGLPNTPARNDKASSSASSARTIRVVRTFIFIGSLAAIVSAAVSLQLQYPRYARNVFCAFWRLPPGSSCARSARWYCVRPPGPI